MKLFTSLPPRDTKGYRDSWTAAGFLVMTVNSVREMVFPDGPPEGVEIVRVERDAAPLVGKPLVYFDDILKVAAESCAGEIFGIINADIILDVGDDFIAFIREQARGGVVFGSRTEIDDPNGRDGEMYIEGFDFFFIDPDIVPLYPPSNFCLGAPWWDYWTPLVPLLHSVPVKWLVTPVAYHVRHAIIWDPDHHLSFGKELISHLGDEPLEGALGEGLAKAITSSASHPDLYPFSLEVCRFIRENAAHVHYPTTPSPGETALDGEKTRRGLTAFIHSLGKLFRRN
jgi:hypothetical protein